MAMHVAHGMHTVSQTKIVRLAADTAQLQLHGIPSQDCQRGKVTATVFPL